MVSSTLVTTGVVSVAVITIIIVVTVFYLGENGSGSGPGPSSGGSSGVPSGAGAGTLVHLFEWQWNDIALECQNFLGPKGFQMVQISPPTAHAYYNNSDGIGINPWWARYQPVHYGVLNSRSGTQSQFLSMINACFTSGVGILVDVVANHQAGSTQTCSNTTSWVYQNGNNGGVPFCAAAASPSLTCSLNRTYPLFSSKDFHANSEFSIIDFDYTNSGYAISGVNVKFNDLGGVQDLNTDCGTLSCNATGCSSTYGTSCNVRNQISKYLQSLLCLGVRGFRFDASKNQSPNDLWTYIDNAVSWANQTNGCTQGSGIGPGNTWWGGNAVTWQSASQIDAGFFPFIYLEVEDTNGVDAPGAHATDYLHTFNNNGVSYQAYIADFGSEFNIFPNFKQPYISWLVAQTAAYSPPGFGIGTQWQDQIGWFGPTYGLSSSNALMFTDNHDDQRTVPGSVITNFFGSAQYTNANAFMLAFPYGTPLIMSSFQFQNAGQWWADTDVGPPSDQHGNTNNIWTSVGGSMQNTGCSALSPSGSNNNIGVSGGWICEHRWQGIANMVGWRNVVSGGSWLLRNQFPASGNTNPVNPAMLGFVRDGDGTSCSSQQRCNIGAAIAINNNNTGAFIGSWFVGLPDGYYCNIARNDYINDASLYSDGNGNAVPTCANYANDNNVNDAILQVRNGILYYSDGNTPITIPPLSFIAIHTAAVLPSAQTPPTALAISYPGGGTVSAMLSAPFQLFPVVTPGVAPFTYAITAGTLPSGLGLSPTTGVITGTPTATSTSLITFQITDTKGNTATTTVTFNAIAPAAPSYVSCFPSSITYNAGLAANITCSVPSGSASVTWSLYSGTLPNNIALGQVGQSGLITGTTTAVSFSPQLITVAASTLPAYGPVQTTYGTFTIGVAPTVAAFTFTPNSFAFPLGTIISPISNPCGVPCGPYTIKPTLQAGLSFDTQAGTISGTPAAASSTSINFAITSSSIGASTNVTIKTVALLSVYTSCFITGSFNGWATTGRNAAMSLVSNYMWQLKGFATLQAGTQYQFKILCGGIYFSSGYTYIASNGIVGGTNLGQSPNNMFFWGSSSTGYNVVFNDQTMTFTIAPGSFPAPIVSYAITPSNPVVSNSFILASPTVSPGNFPYTYAVTSGSLPAGLSINSANGIISGTPTATTTTTVTVTVTDSSKLTGSASVRFSVSSPTAPPFVACAPSGVTYSAGVSVSIVCRVPSDSVAPLTWSSSSKLPAGLSFVLSTLSSGLSTFTLSGTTTNAPFLVTSPITVTASGTSTTFYIGVSPLNTDISYYPASQPLLTNSAITWTSKCGASCSPYSVSPGLPAGLSLNTATGTISGKPTSNNALSVSYTVSAGALFTTVNISSITTMNYAACSVSGSWNGYVAPSCSNITSGTLTPTANNIWQLSNLYLSASQKYSFQIVCLSACGGSTTSFSSGISYPTTSNLLSGTTSGSTSLMTMNWSTSGNYCLIWNDLASLKNFTFRLLYGPPSISYGVYAGTVSGFNSYSVGGQLTSLLNFSPTVTSGNSPFTYAYSGGVLPSGFSFASSSGVISSTGSSSAASTTIFVTVTDALGQTGTSIVNIIITTPAAPSSVTCVPASITYAANAAVSIACTVPVGTAAPTWNISGTIPTGLYFNPVTGALTGQTNTTAFPATTFIVGATNSAGTTYSSFTIQIAPTNAVFGYPSIISLRTNVPTSILTLCGNNCSAYSISPALPPGLSLSSSTGTISGSSPFYANSTTYTVSSGSVNVSFSLGVYSSTCLSSISLNGTLNGATGVTGFPMKLYGNNSWYVSSIALTASTKSQFKIMCGPTQYSTSATLVPVSNSITATLVVLSTQMFAFTPTVTTTYRALYNDVTRVFSLAVCVAC